MLMNNHLEKMHFLSLIPSYCNNFREITFLFPFYLSTLQRISSGLFMPNELANEPEWHKSIKRQYNLGHSFRKFRWISFVSFWLIFPDVAENIAFHIRIYVTKTIRMIHKFTDSAIWNVMKLIQSCDFSDSGKKDFILHNTCNMFSRNLVICRHE